MQAGKKIYFASDLHLGIPDRTNSLVREKKFVRWLEFVRSDAEEIHLMGDIFDFWFEYKQVIPRGFVRLFGKIAELVDAGIKIHWHLGNHDMWIFDYIPTELGVNMFDGPVELMYNEKKFHLAHGDGLGPGDQGYKFMKRIFRNGFCQWIFERLHPNFGIWLANKMSRTSRNSESDEMKQFLGEEKEWLVVYSKEILAQRAIDYFIYGHRHTPIDHPIDTNARYINLGDWVSHFTYAVFDGTDLELKTYEE